MKYPNLLSITCSLLLSISLFGCGDRTEIMAGRDDIVLGAVEVKTQILEEKPWVYTIESFGQLNVADTVRIGIQSPGTITQVDLAEGTRVLAGEQLFTLDEKKQQLRFEQARASLEEAKTQLAQSESSLKRFTALRGEGAISEDQLVQSTTNYEAAIARLDQARALLDIAKTELAERRVVSPVDGVVEMEAVEIGQFVQPGEVLARIQADGDLQVSAHVNEREVIQITVGQRANVFIGGANYTGVIESVGRTADPATGNYEVKLRIQSPSTQLREGMSTRVNLNVVSDSPVLIVPREAVVDRNRVRVVFVLEDGRAVAKKVQFGLPNELNIPVISGLKPGDQLILSPLSLITNGTEVIAIEANGS